MLSGLLALLPDFDALALLAVRSAALIALGWLGACLLKRALPGARLALWATVVAGLLALPPLSATLPAWRVLPIATPVETASPEPTPASVGGLSVAVPDWVAGESKARPAQSARRWTDWAVVTWAAGAILFATFFLAGLVRLRGVRRRAWAASPSLHQIAQRVAGDFAVRRHVPVMLSADIASPATWGLWRPVVVLPLAATRWNEERSRLVLAHEMAHVARGDWVWRLLAQAGCVLYWFNPLAWIAARRLRFEQELSCDLAVVEGGIRPSVYADHLLNIACAASGGRFLPLVALDMARTSQMEGRLMSILADRSTRRLRRGFLVPALALLAALPVVAAVQPQAPEAPPAPEADPAAPPAAVAPVVPPTAAATALAPVVAPKAVGPASVAPAPVASPAPAVGLTPAVAPVVSPSPQTLPAPALAPSPATSVRPAFAPVPRAAPSAVYGVLAANDVSAPSAPRPPAPPVADEAEVAPEDRARARELEEQIEAKAAEIEELMEPIHLEMERAMNEGMAEMMAKMEAAEIDMRPIGEEMSRLGEEMSRKLEESMPEQLEMEEHALRAEAIGREMEERSRLIEQALEGQEQDSKAIEESVRRMHEELAPLREQMAELHREMAERRRSMVDVEAITAPYREQMEALRQQMAPQRERMEELRRQFEPQREAMRQLRDERMAEVRGRMETLSQELRELARERAEISREYYRDRSDG